MGPYCAVLCALEAVKWLVEGGAPAEYSVVAAAGHIPASQAQQAALANNPADAAGKAGIIDRASMFVTSL